MTRVKRSVHARKKRRATSIASCGLSPTTSGTSRGSPPHPAATSNQVRQQAPTDNLSADTRRRDLNRGTRRRPTRSRASFRIPLRRGRRRSRRLKRRGCRSCRAHRTRVSQPLAPSRAGVSRRSGFPGAAAESGRDSDAREFVHVAAQLGSAQSEADAASLRHEAAQRGTRRSARTRGGLLSPGTDSAPCERRECCFARQGALGLRGEYRHAHSLLSAESTRFRVGGPIRL